MKALTDRKWDGVLSFVMVVSGVLLLKLTGLRLDSPASKVLAPCWCTLALVLAVSGLRGGSVLTVLGSALTIACFVCLFWVLEHPYHGSRPAPITAAVTQLGAFSTALEAFREDNGFYPTGTNGLQDLVRQPVGTTNWHQYLDSIPKDPWGNDYAYECPAKHTSSGYPYDLSSPGPPRENSPIANWQRPALKP